MKAKKYLSKKGSLSIFIMMLLVTMIGSLTLIINYSKAKAVTSISKSIGTLTMQSLLSEFNKELYKRYDIFAYEGLERDVAEKIDFYFKEAIRKKSYIKLGKIETNLFNYKLSTEENFKKQMLKVGKFDFLNRIVNREKKRNDLVKYAKIEAQSEGENIKLKNSSLVKGLPSYGKCKNINIKGFAEKFRNIKNLKDIGKVASNNTFICSYILSHTNNYIGKNIEEGFFRNQLEYVISGKYSDKENLEGVKRRIVAIREIFNTISIHKDREKLAEIETISEMITPGLPAKATGEALIFALALAESENDYKLLISGKKVPLIKDKNTWAVTVENVVKKEKNYIGPKIKKGNDYEDYLKGILYLEDNNKKVYRMMDIVTMDMKSIYYRNFNMNLYNDGVDFQVMVNNKNYRFSKGY